MKDNKLIGFSEDIDLSKISGLVDQADGNLMYNCYAICNHRGTLASGHYYAKCKSEGKWYKLNDEFVTPISGWKDVVD